MAFIKRSTTKLTKVSVGNATKRCAVCNNPFVSDDENKSICQSCVNKSHQDETEAQLS